MIAQNMILAVAVLGMAALGFLIMKRLDTFLDDNEKRIDQEEKGERLSCEMLTTDLPDEELMERIRTYEKKHGNAHIVLYQDENDLYNELFDGKR